ncbi:MAG TPA: hypothetical protein VLB67_04445 [Acidimicrobiia bacterium]|nr:hypothetical protein [Acidimicrobiia bacterium]
MDGTRAVVIEWLLDSDPAIRWQALRDLTDAAPAVIAGERARIPSTGWGAALLSLQQPDGNWGGGAYSPKWTSTTYTLLLLRHFGPDPDDERVRRATERVRDRVTMGGGPFFEYREETCIAGMVLSLGATFRVDREASTAVAEWLLAEQLPDGGWNCRTRQGSTRSSFHTTISVLEGLLDLQVWLDHRRSAAVDTARRRGEEYLLERRLMFRKATGELVDPRWRLFSFPPRWHYDVLRGLDHLRAAGRRPDDRWAEAVGLVESKRTGDGRWLLQNRYAGREHFPLEDGPGKPSRWNTLRALRVLRWYRSDGQPT